MLTISVFEFRKPKIFRRERKMMLTISVFRNAENFRFRNSETEIAFL